MLKDCSYVTKPIQVRAEQEILPSPVAMTEKSEKFGYIFRLEEAKLRCGRKENPEVQRRTAS